MLSEDGQRGYAVGTHGAILSTQDSGRQWREQSNLQGFLYDIAFSGDGKLGWAVGFGGVIYHSNDGGLSWTKQRDWDKGLSDGMILWGVAASQDGRRAWAVGGSQFRASGRRRVLTTTDGGQTWHQEKSNEPALYDVFVKSDGKEVWAVGGDERRGEGRILKTLDGGDSWQEVRKGGPLLFKIVFQNDGESGWILGAEGLVLVTADSGANWSEHYLADSGSLLAVTALKDGSFIAVGENMRTLAGEVRSKTHQ